MNKHYNNTLMMIKKEDHNTDVNNCVEKFLIENLIKNFKNGSSNINEVIRAILNFFIEKFYKHKKHKNAYKQTKKKNALKNHLRGKKSLICSFALLCFCLGVFVPFSAFSAFTVCEIFS